MNGLAQVMRRIAQDAITRAAAAKRLGVSERHVNRLMRRNGVKRPARPKSSRHGERVTAQARRAAKERAARAALAGQCTVENAAMQAGCSPRTMYRWVKKLEKQKKNAQKSTKSARKR